MASITRYVLSQLAGVTFFVTLGLTFAVWFTQSLRLIDHIVNRGLPASTAFSFMVRQLPWLLPIAACRAILATPSLGLQDPTGRDPEAVPA